MSERTEEPVIELRDVWRRYRLVSERYRHTLRGSIAQGPRSLRREWFWALRGVDLSVHRGDAVAVIGRNGAGKSTLLRLAGGVGRPDQGSVRVIGRIGALLDLGREFHPDLTGHQNAELAAVVAGLSRAEFARRVDEIVDFAGLAGFVDQPLHAYSDGMRARLAFSVLAHVDPEVLLVDEVLAVGDAAFQRRSADRIAAMRERGAAVLFVSHDLSLVREVCDAAAWLDGGVIRAVGPSEDVVAEYLETTASVEVEPLDAHPRAGGPLRAVRVVDRWGAPAAAVRTGDGLVIELDVDAPPAAGPLQVSVKVRRCDAPATVAVDTSTPVAGSASMRLVFERLDLAPARHEVVVGLFRGDWSTRLDERRLVLDVVGEGPDHAVLAPPHEWQRVTPD